MDVAHHYIEKKRSSIMKEEIRERMEEMSEDDKDNDTMLVNPMFQWINLFVLV